VKPPFTYYGGKTALADRIVEALPAHLHYVEPFAGSLAVLLAKPVSPYETANDLSGDIVTFWRVLRDRSEELLRVCSLTPHSRAELELSYLPCRDDEIEQARRVWVRLTQGRTSRLTPTGWRSRAKPAGASVPRYLTGYSERLQAAAQRLANVSLECRPAVEVIERYGGHDGVLIYADPPYLASTRNGTNYAHEMAGPNSHRALADALGDCKAAVVLSGYHSLLYDQLYDGWYVYEISTSTHQGNGGADYNASRTEVLWSNRPFGAKDVLSSAKPHEATS
jgi:DNA adenine methylase